MAGKKMPKEAKKKEKLKGGEEITINEHRAMIYLPENAVQVTVNAKVFMDGEIHDVYKVISMEEIRDAFRRADDGYIDEDDVFVLTDKGRAMMEEAD